MSNIKTVEGLERRTSGRALLFYKFLDALLNLDQYKQKTFIEPIGRKP